MALSGITGAGESGRFVLGVLITNPYARSIGGEPGEDLLGGAAC